MFILTALAAVFLTGCAQPKNVVQPTPDEGEHAAEAIKVETYSLRPQTAYPGSTIEISVQYSLRLPKSKSLSEVTEVRVLLMGTERLELSRKKIIRAEGTHKSTIKFTLPMDIEKGDYTLQTILSTPAHTKTIEDTLTIKKKGK
ncbi:MAG: hypothetical protein HQL01_12330 [Nitrospirae bacterium]|nr:hypothetical protein [Nitrospirota bacterium]